MCTTMDNLPRLTGSVCSDGMFSAAHGVYAIQGLIYICISDTQVYFYYFYGGSTDPIN